jgi:hypothetical protein
MATDIIARGMAANAKKSVTELGNKVESEKWIGTKAEWEAVDKSTIKDGTIVYITDDKTVILYDKAEMEKIAAQVATDRKAAETAAQTAQAVADSLPDDYVTAVGKIAENTAEIANVKLTDKELQRRVNALYDLGQGITHKFETDSETAYAKTVPTGAKLMSVKNVGGRSIVFNQVVNLNNFRPNYTVNGVTFTKLDNGKFVANGTATGGDAYFSDSFIPIKGHVYLEKSCPKGGSAETYRSYITGSGVVMDINYGSGVIAPINVDARVYIVPLMVKSGATVNNLVVYPQIYDLTAMFGSGNEPASVEEFEKIFPAAYYPYNAGEIVSAGVTEVAVGDTAYPIPEPIRNLPSYGWSAGTAKNYVDYENKKYVQCVGSVDLGTLTWKNGESVSFETHELNGQKLTKSYGIAPNFACPKYSTKTQNAMWGKTSITGITANANVDGYVYVNDTSYTDATAFKQAMQGVMLYYELANPIITDISTIIPDDFLRNIEVEAGGSVTFKGGNDDYRIPVPSEEEYIVKLSEVGGTT